MGYVGSSSSICSVAYFVATTSPVTDSLNQAPTDRLRQQEHKRRFSPGEGLSSREKQIVRNLRRHYEQEGHEALHQQQRLSTEQIEKQQWEAERQLRAEATITAAQTSTQMNAEFRRMAEKNEFNRIQRQEFAIQTEEANDGQRQIYAQEAGEEVWRRGNASCTWFTASRTVCTLRVWTLPLECPLLRHLNLIFKDSYAMPNWIEGDTSKSTMNSASLLQKGIAARSRIVSGV